VSKADKATKGLDDGAPSRR